MLRTLQRHLLTRRFFAAAFLVFIIIGAWQIYDAYAKWRCIMEYSFISGLTVCGSDDAIDKSNYEGLRQQMLSYIVSQKSSGTVRDVAVYYRDLVHGPNFGINELENYAPASLLKLPLALAYMNMEASYPGLFQKRIGYTGTTTELAVQTFAPEVTIEPGHFYTIKDMLYNMLAYSDNRSYAVLGDYFENHIPNGNQLLYQTYQDLGILAPHETLDQNISVHSYASLFRNLYNASYLDPDPSEEVLSWLSQSTFSLGLVSGLPQGMKVAHKFGEFTFPDDTHQLHDCGIVYYPGNPYLLCIMTRGTDWTALEKTIQTLSAMTYAEVESRKL